MPAAPSWLMPHTVTVEPYLGDSAYGPQRGPAVEARALVSETRRQTRDVEGRVTVSTAQLITAPDVDWPPGTRVTLPSGRVTRVLSVAAHTAPGLPVPESCEVMCE